MIVVSDTSPITNLAAIEQLDLLRQLYQTLLIPRAVCHEMISVGKPVPGAVEVQTCDWIRTQSVSHVEAVTRILSAHSQIHLGEAEVIALALEVGADVLLMDERRGRILAQSYGLKVIGILGILLMARKNGLIARVKPVVDQLIQDASFRVSDELYAAVLQEVDEQ